jgi:hypothetical protein
MDAFWKALEQQSALWLVVSAGIGGLIGALIKFLFEQVWGSKYKYRLDAQESLRKYKYPLLRAGDSLDRRLQNFIQFVDKKWYADSEDNYYRLSTLYILGTYFGWCKILEDGAFIEYEISNKRAKVFYTMFNTVYKGLTGFHYFKGAEDFSADEVEAASIYKFTITAVAELMIKKPGKKETTPKIIDFIEFTKLIDSSPDFKRWFGYLDKFLVDICPEKNNAGWNRILVFATTLRAFVHFLDQPKRITAPRTIYYLKHMHPQVRAAVQTELEKHGIAHLIAEEE